MKFSEPVRAPDSLGSYTRLNRPRPVAATINLLEALLSIIGVIAIVMFINAGSFAEAGARTDRFIAAAIEKVKSLASPTADNEG